MDVYKLYTDSHSFMSISKSSFERHTRKGPPWYRTKEDGKTSQFAVCPACNNPIQIIGLYKLPASITRPFARHATSSIPGLASLDLDAREYCPYFKPQRRRRSDRKQSMSGLPTEILRLLISQFDRVIYLIQKQTGIRFSRAKIESMLQAYRASEGYLYTGATLTNIPWIFAYMTNSTALFGQRIYNNSDLVKSILEAIPAADITSDGRVTSKVFPDRKKSFFDLNICFVDHQLSTDAQTGVLTETMEMMVFTKKQGRPKNVHLSTLQFDHKHFENLINLQANQANREIDLVEMAETVLGDLVITNKP